jgi:hypothetical protein
MECEHKNLRVYNSTKASFFSYLEPGEDLLCNECFEKVYTFYHCNDCHEYDSCVDCFDHKNKKHVEKKKNCYFCNKENCIHEFEIIENNNPMSFFSKLADCNNCERKFSECNDSNIIWLCNKCEIKVCDECYNQNFKVDGPIKYQNDNDDKNDNNNDKDDDKDYYYKIYDHKVCNYKVYNEKDKKKNNEDSESKSKKSSESEFKNKKKTNKKEVSGALYLLWKRRKT